MERPAPPPPPPDADPSHGGPDPETLRQRLHVLVLASRLSAPSALAFVAVGLMVAAHGGVLLLAPRSVHGGLHPAALLFAGAKDGPLLAAGEWWRLLAANWLHASWGHLLINAAGMLLLLQAAANVLGSARAVAVTVLGGAASFAVSTLVSPLPSVGSSGAVHALLGALAAFALRHRRALPRQAWPWLAALGGLWASLAALAATSRSTTDLAAHAGGLASGALLGLLLSGRPRLLSGGPERRPLPVALLGAGCTGAALGALAMCLSGASLRFDLPDPGLREAAVDGLVLRLPGAWAPGHAREGLCDPDPAPPAAETGPALPCWRDPYGAVLLLGPADRILPGRGDAARPEAGSDTVGDVSRRWRRLAPGNTLALLCYGVIVDKYDGLWDAVAGGAGLPREPAAGDGDQGRPTAP